MPRGLEPSRAAPTNDLHLYIHELRGVLGQPRRILSNHPKKKKSSFSLGLGNFQRGEKWLGGCWAIGSEEQTEGVSPLAASSCRHVGKKDLIAAEPSVGGQGLDLSITCRVWLLTATILQV